MRQAKLVTPTLVRPNGQSGSAAKRTATKVRDGSPRSLRRGRPAGQQNGHNPASSFPSAYEAVRTEEIRLRSQLFRLRAGRLSGELLDRKLLLNELTAQYTAIRDIILGSSKLTQREKENLLRNLTEIPVLLEPAANV